MRLDFFRRIEVSNKYYNIITALNILCVTYTLWHEFLCVHPRNYAMDYLALSSYINLR